MCEKNSQFIFKNIKQNRYIRTDNNLDQFTPEEKKQLQRLKKLYLKMGLTDTYYKENEAVTPTSQMPRW